MSTLDHICALEERRIVLLRRDWRNANEVSELRDIAADLAKLWSRRRCEMSGAAPQPIEEYRARRAGLASVEAKVTAHTGREVQVS